MRTLTLLAAGSVPLLAVSLLVGIPAQAACTIGSGGASIGTLPANSSLDDEVAGQIVVNCGSPSDAFALALDRGLSTSANREMRPSDAGAPLPYHLAPSSNGKDWGDPGCGDTFPSGKVVYGAGSMSIPVYASIGNTGLHAGLFNDVVTALLCNGENCASSCAASDSAVIPVSATVRTDCRIVSVSTADFGSVRWNEQQIAVKGLAAITLACAGDTPVLVGLDAGEHPDAAGGRRMAAGNSLVSYSLRTPGGDNWGDVGIDGGGTFQASPVTLPPAGTMVTLDIDGEAFPADAPPGRYVDRVTVTVQF